MFKFMKSKKGFTLVELMIVVVIMAILVAVAVPIYSAVTANARKKTCIGNQREIVSSVGNWLMLNEKATVAGSFDITNTNGVGAFAASATGLDADDYTAIKAGFKTIPFCPEDGNAITVTITANDADTNPGGFSTVATECDNAEHVLETND